MDARDPRHTGRPRDAREPSRSSAPSATPAQTYVGRVAHSRKYPVRRRLAYPLRCALIDHAPPPWFLRSGQADDHLGADECRARCGASAPRKLLTSRTFGCAQNPNQRLLLLRRTTRTTTRSKSFEVLRGQVRA